MAERTPIPPHAAESLQLLTPNEDSRLMLKHMVDTEVMTRRNTWTPYNKALEELVRRYARALGSEGTLFGRTWDPLTVEEEIVDWFEENWISFEDANRELVKHSSWLPQGVVRRMGLLDFLERLADPSNVELIPNAAKNLWEGMLQAHGGDTMDTCVTIEFQAAEARLR